MEHQCQEEAVVGHLHLQLAGGICLQHGFRQARWFFGLFRHRGDQFHRRDFHQRHPGESCFQELPFLLLLLRSLLKSRRMIGTEGVACHLPPRDRHLRCHLPRQGTHLHSDSGPQVERCLSWPARRCFTPCRPVCRSRCHASHHQQSSCHQRAHHSRSMKASLP